jgi:hypothetical protein
MTKKNLNELKHVLNGLNIAVKYLQREDVSICSNALPHALSFYNKEGKGITPMQKFVGSDLCYLLNSRDYLIRFIENIENPPKAVEPELQQS